MALFMSSTIQGEITFLISGGYEMDLEGNTEGSRSAVILMFDGINKNWRVDRNNTHMEVKRGGHTTIPITYSNHLSYLMGNKSFKWPIYFKYV